MSSMNPIKTLPRRISEDFSYKTVALGVALVLWVTMLGRKDVTVSRGMPLQFLNGAHFEVVNKVADHVDVEVVGPRMALKKFTQMDQVFTIDLTDLMPGTHKVTLTPDGFSVPVGVKVVAIHPEEITVTVKEVTERSQ